MRLRPYGRSHIFLSLLTPALIVFATDALAQETVRGSRRRSTQKEDRAPSSFSVLPTEDSDAFVVNGEKYSTTGSVKAFPPLPEVFKAACRGLKTRRANLCQAPKDQEAIASYEAAAKSLGFPAQGLVCLTKIESRMIAGLTSPVGAKGLTQFMPATARHYDRLMKRDPAYQKAFAEYRDLGGTNGRDLKFTSSRILSTSLQDSGIQIFASAMYWREGLKGFESFWAKHLGAPENPNKGVMMNMMRSLLIGYNAGNGRAKTFVNRIKRDPARSPNYSSLPIPGETKGYLRNFDACMNSAEPATKARQRLARSGR